MSAASRERRRQYMREYMRQRRANAYEASPLSSTERRPGRRRFSTAEDYARFRTALADLTDSMEPPMTVRQVFYQATVQGLVEKTEYGYRRVQVGLRQLRMDGVVPWSVISDNTRWMRKPRTFSSPTDAMRRWAATYRKSMWDDASGQVEVWVEKDALAGVVVDVTSDFDVPLMVARGYSSLTFLYATAESIIEDGRPAHIYHLGDYDPSGQDAARHIEETLREFAAGCEIHFTRLAVTPRQIRDWRLPTRPTKTSDGRSRSFGAISVELDAISPDRLRGLVRGAVERHLPQEQYEVLKTAEENEREGLEALAAAVQGKNLEAVVRKLTKRG
jgi:hypothetical protein